MNKTKCLRCGEEWMQRVEKPVMCPRCKSPYYDRPRRRVIDTIVDNRIAECVKELEEAR